MRVLKQRTFTGTKDSAVTQREIENRSLARKVAAEGMVLLKNEDHFLPLKRGSKIALFGIGAGKTIKGGTGSGDVNERESISIAEGLANAGYEITTTAWISDYDQQYDAARIAWRDTILGKCADDKDLLNFFNTYSTTKFEIPAGGEIYETEAETAMYVLSRIAGEGADRFAAEGDYYLSKEERRQLKAICTLYKNVIVVVNAGGLVDLSFMDEYSNIKSLLHIIQPGMEGGNALADLISGDVVPSGKLTDTWAFRYEDYPSSEKFSHNNGNVEEEYYEDGIYVGYRYFDTFDVPVRYGFGYGMSYTDFDIRVKNIAVKDKDTVSVNVVVKNTGNTFSGKEVVQVYVTCPRGSLPKEYRRLAAFAKTDLLAPQEEQEVTLFIPVSGLTSYCEKTPGWILEKGSYLLWVGNSLLSSKIAGILTLDENTTLTGTKNICVPKKEIKEIAPDQMILEERYETALKEAEEQGLPSISLHSEDYPCRTVEYKKNAELYSEEAYAFTETLTEEELIALASGDPGKGQGSNLGSAGITVPGSAGETNNCYQEKGLGSMVLADGPAGLRLNKFYFVKDGNIVPMPFLFSLEGGLFYTDEFPEGDRYYQYCTAIPVGILLAQTWDVALLEEIGEMIGNEMQLFNTTLWLAPGMNIHRNPLCGRNFEYYSEDPLVAGRIAGAITKGVQNVPGCGTTIKHFACNNQEDNRMGVDSILSERALREIYLKGFEIAVTEEQPMSLMTSYNLVNGIHAANNYDLCTEALRNEWGFRGMIMTDWTTTTQGPDCTASGCMRAGNDLVMPGALLDRSNLEEELADGRLQKADMQACIARTVDLIWQSNAYENAVPYKK